MKIFHLHLEDPFGNKQTLICKLKEGAISYLYYSSHGAGGTPFALSNMQCTLPIDKISEEETKEEFTERVVELINTKSVCKVVNRVNTEVKF